MLYIDPVRGGFAVKVAGDTLFKAKTLTDAVAYAEAVGGFGTTPVL